MASTKKDGDGEKKNIFKYTTINYCDWINYSPETFGESSYFYFDCDVKWFLVNFTFSIVRIPEIEFAYLSN